jgi:hypothetical protein
MEIVTVYSYLVPPRAREDETPKPIRGTVIKAEDDIFEMVQEVFDDAPKDCLHDVAFLPREDGKQENHCLSLIFDFVQAPTTEKGREIASRLGDATTHRSGLGLLFLILGRENDTFRIVVSRFPADQGVIAQEEQSSLTVEYVRQVFLKSERAYKCAMYEGVVIEDFWRGKAVDKQINSDRAISAYWIQEFLLSDFAVTGERGTRQLAVALRKVVNHETDLEITSEISGAVNLSKNLEYQVTSIEGYVRYFRMSEKTAKAIEDSVKPAVFREQFRFVHDEFKKHIAYKRVELDNGAVLTAMYDEFDQIFDRGESETGEVSFTTTGEITAEKYRTTLR